MLRSRILTGIVALTAGSVAVAALLQEPAPPTPTKHHEMLQQGVGEWEGTLTMMEPGMPTDPVRATDSIKAFGPFWTTSRFECDFMGMPYSGNGQMGYDSAKKKFVGTWIDNMSSYLAVMEGEYDEEKGVLVMHWDAPDMTGKIVPHSSEAKHSENSYVMQFFRGKDEPVKIMEIRMKRKPMEAGADK